MDERAQAPQEARSTEELTYARWLDACTRIGFALLVGSFLLYITGVLPPHVPVHQLPLVWGLPVDRYLAATGMPSGWGWLALLARGDVLNFAGVAFLSMTTLICYLRVLPILVRRRDRVFATIVALEIAVLALAASGMLSGGT